MRPIRALLLLVILAFGPTAAWAGSGSEDTPERLGVGAHYWRALKDVEGEDVDSEGISWSITYQYRPRGWWGSETALEWYRKGYGGAKDDVLGPLTYLIFGKELYGAFGVGGYYSGGVFANDLFYTLRLAFDFELWPGLRVDVNVNYRFENWDDLNDSDKNIGSDTMTLGGALRMAF